MCVKNGDIQQKSFNAKLTPRHKCKKETWFFVSKAPPGVSQNSLGHHVIQSKKISNNVFVQNKQIYICY